MVERLAFLQLDPTAAVAPSADLVSWSRLGPSYDPQRLTAALEHDRTLFELDALVRPMSDLPLYLAELRAWPTRESLRAWLDANARFRKDVLARLRDAGPLLSRDVPDTCQVPWSSSGWTGNRNVTQMLEFLVLQGEVAVSARRGRERLWDLAERVYPPDLEASRPTRPCGDATSAGCGRWASRARRPGRCRWSPSMSATRASPRSSRACAGSGGSTPRRSRGRSRAAPRSSRRSTGSSTTASVRSSSSTSSTCSRCTSPRRRAAGATSRSPCCTATGSSASSTRRPTARPPSSACTRSTRT